MALFVFSNLREQKGGLTRAWLRRLSLFHEAGWETHVATIHRQPEIDETLAAWRERGWLPVSTKVHHYQRRTRRFRSSWSRATDDDFTRDDRIADWLDWLVGLLPGVLVFADSPVTYAPVAMMRNPYIGRIMTAHLAHRAKDSGQPRKKPAQQRSRYQGPAGQPKLMGRFLPYADQADAVVTLTRRQAEHLAQDVPGLSPHVIPNIVDPPQDLQLPVERDRLRVVCVGRLDPLKRFDEAMRAVGLAREQVPGLRLDIYGRGPDLERLEALRRDLGLEDVVTFCGFTETPFAALARARASLMTSRREGFGLAVAESLTVGTPVVTYDVDYGPAELIADGVNGRVVADGDVQGLAAALVEVLTDDVTWAALSAAGPSAVERLGQAQVGSAWLELATEVAAGVRVPEPGLLIEDVGVRSAGAQVLGVAYSVDGRGPTHLGVGAVAIGPGRAGALMAADPTTDGGPASDGRTVSAVTVTLPFPALDEALRADPTTRPEGGTLLTSLEADGRVLPARNSSVPTTVLPTPFGVLVVRPVGESLAIAPADRVLPLLVAPDGIESELDGEPTVLNECPQLEAGIDRKHAPDRIWVRCWSPGLDVLPGAALSLIARAEPSRVVGTVRLTAEEPASGPSGRWRGTGTIDWDADALAAGSFDVPRGVDLGLSGGRSLRSVASITGPGRPVRVRLTGGSWVLATSSTGSLMLLRGRGLRARAGWTLRAVSGRARR